MKSSCGNRVVLAFLVSLAAVSTRAAPATKPAVTPTSPTELRKAALGDDFVESLAAVRQLAASGEAERTVLREVGPQLLARDAATVAAEAAAAPAELPKLRSAEAEVATFRSEALRAIEQLTPEPKAQKAAKQIYERLSAVQGRLAAGYGRQAKVVNAMARRAECLALLRAAGAAPAPAGEEERLSRSAEQALGMPADVAVGFTRGGLEPPKEAASAGRRGLWFFLSCRRIEAHNRTIEPALNAAEATHARRVNAYREMLGLLPYEWDARLIQSARRHSKEMVDVWYFSHYSPTESERSPWRRMGRAGYPDPSNENITMGSWGGEDAFWKFFASPDHHRAWIDPAATALGVGKWENAWTEDIGSGRRLMLAGAEARAKAVVLGDELKPQTVEVTRRHPRDLRDVKFYDAEGREVGKAGTVMDPKGKGHEGPAAGPAKPGSIEVEVQDPKGGTTIRWGSSRGTTGPS